MPLKIRDRFKSILPQMKKKAPVIKYNDFEDLDLNVLRYRPVSLDELVKKVNFSKRELQIMYRGFKQECPTGMITKENFKQIYCQFFPQGDATKYAEWVFYSFDKNNTGSLSFEDIVEHVSLLARGTTNEKLEWIFRLYDTSNKGVILLTDMRKIVKAIYDMIGKHTIPPVTDEIWRHHAESLFEALDLNKDGVVTKDEFMEYCELDSSISQTLLYLDTVF